MHVVLGANGHVGSAVAEALLRAGEPVIAALHNESKAKHWRSLGAEVVSVDVGDPGALHDVFRSARRAFVLNPPADPSTDSDTVERATAKSIVDALADSGLEKVVAASTYGVQPGERIGDLSVLYEFEEDLQGGAIPTAINRGAYYFSNWDAYLGSARNDGVIPSMLPAAFDLPMVAPGDLGTAAARRMMSPPSDGGVIHVEGPNRYSPNDVAAAFSSALRRDVTIEVVPPEQWIAAFRHNGFSEAAAESYARMTQRTIDEGELPADPRRGTTTLDQYVRTLAATR